MPSVIPGADIGTRNLSALDSKLRTAPINDDMDISQMAHWLRDLGLGTADTWDTAADRIYDRLFAYDRGRRGSLGRQRARLVVAPLRFYAAGCRMAHRFAFRMMDVYRKQYGEDIAMNNSAKTGGTPFTPGGRH